jgi:hypothetical protein
MMVGRTFMKPLWIPAAFSLGFAVCRVGRPLLAGYFFAGFMLQAVGVAAFELVDMKHDAGFDFAEHACKTLDDEYRTKVETS